MKIILTGQPDQQTELHIRVNAVLEDLGLDGDIEVDRGDDAYAADIGIKESPALSIEEPSINFKDMIFEGVVPENGELRSMFISIFGGDDVANNCGPGGCSDCTSGCTI